MRGGPSNVAATTALGAAIPPDTIPFTWIRPDVCNFNRVSRFHSENFGFRTMREIASTTLVPQLALGAAGRPLIIMNALRTLTDSG